MSDDMEVVYATVEALTKPRLPEDDVPVPGVGLVRVRGLSRGELMDLRARGLAADEPSLFSLAMLRPTMTVEQVEAWRAASPAGELESVSDKVYVLSGLGSGAQKAVMKELLSDPDAEFRDVPGSETSDDGSPAPGGNVG